jgi:hypothetical protein
VIHPQSEIICSYIQLYDWNNISEKINNCMKKSKNYQRDTLFIQELYKNTNIDKNIRCVNAVVIDILPIIDDNIEKSKIKLYIPSWKKSVSIIYANYKDKNTFQSTDTLRVFTLKEGDNINVSYSMNIMKPCWKDRMIIDVNTDYQIQ